MVKIDCHYYFLNISRQWFKLTNCRRQNDYCLDNWDMYTYICMFMYMYLFLNSWEILTFLHNMKHYMYIEKISDWNRKQNFLVKFIGILTKITGILIDIIFLVESSKILIFIRIIVGAFSSKRQCNNDHFIFFWHWETTKILWFIVLG